MSTTVLSKNITITGTVKSSDELVLHGTINGDINCTKLFVEDNGKINGDVIGEDVIVCGKVNGSVRGTKVNLRKTAKVSGDITHRFMSVELGTVYSGKLRCDKSIGSE